MVFGLSCLVKSCFPILILYLESFPIQPSDKELAAWVFQVVSHYVPKRNFYSELFY